MLRQVEWWVRNRPIAKNGGLPVTTLFFKKFSFSLRSSCIELLAVPKTLFVSAGVLFDGASFPGEYS